MVGEAAWIVQVDHVAGIINFGELFVSDDRQPWLSVGTLGVAALFAIDDEDGAFDAAKKLNGLS